MKEIFAQLRQRYNACTFFKTEKMSRCKDRTAMCREKKTKTEQLRRNGPGYSVEAVREEEVKLRGFVKEVGFKQGVKKRGS